MLRLLRRSSWTLLWLALVLLPVRGWAFAAMQMTGAADSAAVAVVMPCHGEEAAADSAPAGHACNLCDLCHSAALPIGLLPTVGNYLPPQVAVAAPLALVAGPPTFFRPPRG